MIRVVLFDLDGVLTPTGPYHYQALNLALIDNGFARIEEKQHREIYDGLPTAKKLEMLVERGLVHPDKVKLVANAKRIYTKSLLKDAVKFDPGIYCLMAGLKTSGRGIGIVTNAIADTAIHIACKMNLAAFVETYTTNEDGPPKPAPDLYQLACRRHSVQPHEALAIEDGKHGIDAARRAGCKVLAVSGPADVTPELVWKHLEV